ncbi:MAG: hypothetical protein LBK53_03985 [Heliobacteriaceae bacterium]|jgi:hypothetical protein|nr:hypothetical protein [Heliobacteriaceae bacterium]
MGLPCWTNNLIAATNYNNMLSWQMMMMTPQNVLYTSYGGRPQATLPEISEYNTWQLPGMQYQTAQTSGGFDVWNGQLPDILNPEKMLNYAERYNVNASINSTLQNVSMLKTKLQSIAGSSELTPSQKTDIDKLLASVEALETHIKNNIRKAFVENTHSLQAVQDAITEARNACTKLSQEAGTLSTKIQEERAAANNSNPNQNNTPGTPGNPGTQSANSSVAVSNVTNITREDGTEVKVDPKTGRAAELGDAPTDEELKIACQQLWDGINNDKPEDIERILQLVDKGNVVELLKYWDLHYKAMAGDKTLMYMLTDKGSTPQAKSWNNQILIAMRERAKTAGADIEANAKEITKELNSTFNIIEGAVSKEYDKILKTIGAAEDKAKTTAEKAAKADEEKAKKIKAMEPTNNALLDAFNKDMNDDLSKRGFKSDKYSDSLDKFIKAEELKENNGYKQTFLVMYWDKNKNNMIEYRSSTYKGLLEEIRKNHPNFQIEDLLTKKS